MKKKRHVLKTDPLVFSQSWKNIKPFEIRYDDRHFLPGDELLLRETVHSGEAMPLEYTGREIIVKVLSKLKSTIENKKYGIEIGWCILGLKEIARNEVK